jgi:predicted GNAT family N-acyltransferase
LTATHPRCCEQFAGALPVELQRRQSRQLLRVLLTCLAVGIRTRSAPLWTAWSLRLLPVGEHEEMELSTIVEIRATDPLMSAVYALRHEVFVVEQGVPEELEVDEDDTVAAHLAALSDGNVIGTLRIVRHERTVKIGRMAVSVSLRKKGIGRELMDFAAATASRGGAEEILLGAQLTAREFYKRLGYVEEGAVFDDAGIPHVMMRKKLRP